MAANNIKHLPSIDLALLSTRMATTIGTGTTNSYGLPPGLVAALSANAHTLSTANEVVAAAKAAYHAAVQDRDMKDASCGDVAATIAKMCYANPDVNASMIAALGLSPRSTSRARIVPVTPINLNATPQVNGDVQLAWNRNGNHANVIFRIEAQVGGGEFAFLGETTATKASLMGYAPGTPVSFRVSASKNGAVSAPSAPATIYAATTPPALRLAA